MLLGDRMYDGLKRIFDFSFALILLLFFLPIYLVLYIILKISNDTGPVLHWSKRVGVNEVIFLMPKLRTMKSETPQVATHLLKSPEAYFTLMGQFLRTTSLDEIPQLYSILVGDMSFVGPRPALFNQHDLMSLRRKDGLEKLIPGLTGWAQVNGRDDIEISQKVLLEKEYLKNRSFIFDIKILLITLIKVVKKENIKH